MLALLLSTVTAATSAMDLQGRFACVLPDGPRPPWDAVLRFEQVQGQTMAWVSSLAEGAQQVPVSELVVTDDVVELHVALPSGLRVLEVRSDGANGFRVGQRGAGGGAVLSESLLQRVKPMVSPTIWGGDLVLPSGDLEHITLRVSADGTASRVDLPSHRLFDHPVEVDVHDDDMLEWSLLTRPPTSIVATPIGDEAVGMVSSGGVYTPLTLHRDLEQPVLRPQEHDDAKHPWMAKDVVLPMRIESSVAGTLVEPLDGQAQTVMLLIPGVHEDRNAAAAGHRPLLVLADRLARTGVASLRIDAPGKGASPPWPDDQGVLTNALWSLQLSGIVEQLQESGRWKEVMIGAVGDGALVAMITAARLHDNLDGVLLLSPPALPRSLIDAWQTRQLMHSRSVPEPAIEACVAARLELIRLAGQRVNNDALREAARTWLKAVALTSGGGEPTDGAVDLVLARLLAPGRVGALLAEPRRYLPRIAAPVLAIWGGRDQFMDGPQHARVATEAMQRLGGTVEPHVIDRGTHELGPVPRRGRTRGQVRRTFLPEVLTIIEDWVRPPGV